MAPVWEKLSAVGRAFGLGLLSRRAASLSFAIVLTFAAVLGRFAATLALAIVLTLTVVLTLVSFGELDDLRARVRRGRRVRACSKGARIQAGQSGAGEERFGRVFHLQSSFGLLRAASDGTQDKERQHE